MHPSVPWDSLLLFGSVDLLAIKFTEEHNAHNVLDHQNGLAPKRSLRDHFWRGIYNSSHKETHYKIPESGTVKPHLPYKE